MQEAVKQEYDIPLHDIKPLIEVQEYSLYYLIGLIGLGILVLGVILYFLYKWYKKSKAFNLRVENKKQIDSLDLNDTKNAAYALSQYGEVFKHDSLEHEEKYNKLTLLLQEYKYRKSVDKFEQEVITLIEEYKGMLNV